MSAYFNLQMLDGYNQANEQFIKRLNFILNSTNISDLEKQLA